MYVLAMDTSQEPLCIALMNNEGPLCQWQRFQGLQHASQLLPDLMNMMDQVGLVPAQLDQIVVSIGPGSFTGIRIGIATANGLAMAQKIQVIGISSLEALAYTSHGFGRPVMATINAQRGRVYGAIYIQKDTWQTICSPSVWEKEDFLEKCKQYKDIIVTGDALSMYEIPQSIARSPYNAISATALLQLASMGDYASADAVEPVYLRLSQAEIQWQERQKKFESAMDGL